MLRRVERLADGVDAGDPVVGQAVDELTLDHLEAVRDAPLVFGVLEALDGAVERVGDAEHVLDDRLGRVSDAFVGLALHAAQVVDELGLRAPQAVLEDVTVVCAAPPRRPRPGAASRRPADRRRRPGPA